MLVHYNEFSRTRRKTAKQVREQGVQSFTIRADFNNIDDVETVSPQTHQFFDHVDILMKTVQPFTSKAQAIKSSREHGKNNFGSICKAPLS